MFSTCPIHGTILLSPCGRFDAPCGACEQTSDVAGHDAQIATDTDLSLGYDAGNYAAAYETDDLDAALESPSADGTAAFRAAFVLGFLSTYTIDEMGSHADTYLAAYNGAHGQRCRELGFVQSEQDADDHNFGEAAF